MAKKNRKQKQAQRMNAQNTAQKNTSRQPQASTTESKEPITVEKVVSSVSQEEYDANKESLIQQLME